MESPCRKLSILYLCCVYAVGFAQHTLATNITLLRATEVEDVFRGNDDKYKAVVLSAESVASKWDRYCMAMLTQLPVICIHNLF